MKKYFIVRIICIDDDNLCKIETSNNSFEYIRFNYDIEKHIGKKIFYSRETNEFLTIYLI
jgi:hypothetical protein